MMGIFKWLKKGVVQQNRNRTSLSQKENLNDESYRNALQAFLDRRGISSSPQHPVPQSSPDKRRVEICIKDKKNNNSIPGVPHIPASEVLEIDCVAGTEDRYLELIYAEWHQTRVSLRRHTHPDCHAAVKADLEVLTEIRHPNILLLMGTTQTDDHGLVAIFESVSYTLYNFVHDQGKRISVQTAVRCVIRLADALRHAHARGYIHGALSSHCVYLVSGGTIKLGGWELATNVNNPKPEQPYEERLRAEVFRWQSPEYFAGYTPSKASDVYGLSLLIWEMCTTHVPWNGLTAAEVQQQYVVHKRRVVTNKYDFPSVLNNLLEMGLQLEVTKRIANMNEMRIFLRKVEIQYEEEEPMYINCLSRNNQRIVLKENTQQQKCNKSEWENCYVMVCNRTDETNNSFADTEEARSTSCHSCSSLASTSVITHSSVSYHENPFIEIQRETKELKESTAREKMKFFCGENETSQASLPEMSPRTKRKIWSEAKDRNYEPHKPASHRISLETRHSKTPSEYDPTLIKPASHQNQRSPYSHVPVQVRDSVIQPKVLNPDFQSFFEKSLWKKEKLICLSKMRKDDETGDQSPPTHSCKTHNLEEQNEQLDSPKDDETYTIDDTTDTEDRVTLGDSMPNFHNSSKSNSTEDSISQSTSLQTLKDALDRATDIAQLGSLNSGESRPLSPAKELNDSNVTFEGNGNHESLFEYLHKLNVEIDEIKSIERSAGEDNSLLARVSKNEADSHIDKTKCAEKSNYKKLQTNAENPRSHHVSFANSFTNLLRESITETSAEHNTYNVSMALGTSKSSLGDRVECREASVEAQNCGEASNAISTFTSKDDANSTTDHDCMKSTLTLMLLNNAQRNKGCNSCHQSQVLVRRQSLPATLGPLRSYSPLGKLPIRPVEIPSNSVEDLYIDDEFGGNLNVNMVFFEDYSPIDDEDPLSDLLESSHPRVHV